MVKQDRRVEDWKVQRRRCGAVNGAEAMGCDGAGTRRLVDTVSTQGTAA